MIRPAASSGRVHRAPCRSPAAPASRTATTPRRFPLPVLVIPAVLLLAAAPARATPLERAAPPPDSAAAPREHVAPAAAAARSGPGFLFGAPHAFFALRVGASFPRASSDVFDHSREFLTLERGDFAGVAVSGDLGVHLSSRLDGVFSIGVSHAGQPSEDRYYEDEDTGLPIRQRTSFTQVPVTLGLRFSLAPAGRSVGKLAWIPSRVVPFIEAGGGLTYYRFVQSGDFVDYTDLTIAPAELRSSGWGPTAYVVGGVDVSLSPRWALTAQARYTRASAGMNQSFSDFDDIDLSGLQTTVGLNVRF